MPSQVRFSIIIPIYNVEKYLSECLESVVNQTFHNFEAICIYDESSDKSIDILKDYAKHDKRIKIVYNKEKKGLSHARNIGIEKASGDYIVFLDSDDFLSLNALETLGELCAQKFDVIYYGAKTFEDVSSNFHDYCSFGNFNNPCTGKEMITKMIGIGNVRMASWLQCWNLSFYKQHKLHFYTGILHEDNLFTYLGAMAAEKVTAINDTLYFYRQRPESLFNQEKTVWRLQSWIIIYNEIIKYWNAHSNPSVDFATMQFLREMEPNIYYCYRDLKKTLGYIGGLSVHEKYTLETLVARYNWVETSPICPDVLEMLHNEKKIYIFGAKWRAVKQYNLLKDNNITVSGFIVSDKSTNSQKIDDIPVYDFTDDLEKDALVLIGAGRVLWTEISLLLQKNGFQNICTFNGIGYRGYKAQ